jgi:Trypsin-like peptidase domain
VPRNRVLVALSAFVIVVVTSSCASKPSPPSTEPDLSGLSYSDRSIIEGACGLARYEGLAAYRRCLWDQLAQLKEAPPEPDLSGLSYSDQSIVQGACGLARYSGLAAYRRCLWDQLEQAEINAPAAAPNNPPAASAPLSTPTIPQEAAEQPEGAKQEVLTSQIPWPSWNGLQVRLIPPVKGAALASTSVFQMVEAAIWVVVAGRTVGDFENLSPELRQGSAVAISDSLLLTNCHVLEDRPIVALFRGETTLIATTISADASTDRCVLSLAESYRLTPVPGIREYRDLTVGEQVYTVGAPSGLERTLGNGIISGLRSDAAQHYIQTTAPISPGSSGGGLFDERGNLIGITTLLIEGSQALNFAIAADDYWR